MSNYSLTSISSVIRLIRVHVRCLAVCKINLEDIVNPDEVEAYMQLET